MADAIHFYETLRNSNVQLAAQVPHSGSFLRVSAVQWIPGTTNLAVAYFSRLLIIWDVATSNKVEEFEFAGDGDILLFSAITGHLFVAKHNLLNETDRYLEIINLTSHSRHTLYFQQRVVCLTVIPGTTQAYVGIRSTAIYRIDYSTGTVISGNLLGPKPTDDWGESMFFFLERDWVIASTYPRKDYYEIGTFFISSLSSGTLLFTLDGFVQSITYLPSLIYLLLLENWMQLNSQA